nr:hypothetical protein BaRGS_000214 [Batillaria attramentaria]
MESQPVTLSWQNINVFVREKKKKKTLAVNVEDGAVGGSTGNKGRQQIIKDVSGVVKSGTLVAILGASGAGKSTLMNVLTNRNLKDYVVEGEVKVNGIAVGDGIRNISAYVQQDDLFIGTLTVKETLTFRLDALHLHYRAYAYRLVVIECVFSLAMAAFSSAVCDAFVDTQEAQDIKDCIEDLTNSGKHGETAVVIALILGLIYLRLDLDQKGVMNINGAMFLMITNASFSNMFAVVNSFPNELGIFLREYGSGLYRTDVYYLAKSVAEFPTFILLPVVFVAVTYWMIGYVISTVAGNVSIALAIGPPILIPFMMFGGFFLNDE